MGHHTTSRRLTGRIVHTGDSRSSVFWAAIRGDEDGEIFFSLGRSYLSREIPRPGRRVTFMPLPALPDTRYRRAIEVAVQPRPAAPRGGRIVISRAGDVLRLLLIQRSGEKQLGTLDLSDVVHIADELPA